MSYRLKRFPSGNIVPVAGQRIASRLINAVQGHYVDLEFTGTLTIAGGPADAIVSRGSILSAIDELTITENGATDRILMHGRVARLLTEAAAPSALLATRVTNVAAAAYPLREQVRVFFAHPYSMKPRETAFREHDTRQPLEVQVKLAASGGGDKLAHVSGGVTAVLSNVNVNVVHVYDDSETALPSFQPLIRQIIQPVVNVNAALQVFIRTSNAVRGIVVSQEDTVDGEILDVINSFVLRGDSREIIGPNGRPWKDAVDASAMEFGGSVASYAHLNINFQDHGRLASVLNPNQDNNLRFEFNVQPSVTGHGGSQIRITLLELVYDAALCAPLAIPV